MKIICAALLGIGVALLASEVVNGQKCMNKTTWKEAYVMCRKTHNISAETETQLINRQVPSSLDGKCFLSCLFEKVEVCKDNGDLNDAACNEVCDAVCKQDREKGEALRKAVETCKHAGEEYKGEGPNAHCEKAYLIAQCASKEIEKVWNQGNKTSN